MKPPAFWSDPDSVLGALLAPAALLWRAGAAWRTFATTPWRPAVPVICVGNLVAGGAGKTPVCLSIAARLQARGLAVHMLSRGYGGRHAGPLRVDPDRHGAAEVGDEPLLLAALAPTWVARDRAAGAQAAVAAGAAALVMDDGFQNRSLVKDLSLLVVDGAVGFGNRRVIPAGPLREPLSAGLARADAVVILGEDRSGSAEAVAGRRPVLRADTVPSAASAERLRGRRVLGFAGIGRPGKLRDSLLALGCEIAGFRPFPDHHPFTMAEAAQLLQEAGRLHALPVTTAKDRVRLPPALRLRTEVLEVEVRWRDEEKLDELLSGLDP